MRSGSSTSKTEEMRIGQKTRWKSKTISSIFPARTAGMVRTGLLPLSVPMVTGSSVQSTRESRPEETRVRKATREIKVMVERKACPLMSFGKWKFSQKKGL